MTTRSSDDDASDLGSDASFLRAVAHADVRTPLPPEPDRVGTELGKYRIEAKLGAGGKISIFNAAGSTNVIVDVVGWFPVDNSFTSLVPARVLDTREGTGAAQAPPSTAASFARHG